MIFKSLCSHKLTSGKELKYFTYNFKKTTNFWKLNTQAFKCLKKTTRSVISNCGIPTEKVSKYLDNILKPIMQESWSYVKDLEN